MTRDVFRQALPLALVFAIGGVLTAQTPPQQPPDPTSPRQTAPQPLPEQQADRTPTVTINGCLKQEKDVPGLQPSATARAGSAPGEDFVVTNAKMADRDSAGSPPADQSDTTGRAGAASGSKQGGIYKLAIGATDNEKLRPHLNQQIEVTGSVAMGGLDRSGPPTGTQGTPEQGEPRSTAKSGGIVMPEIQATRIRVISPSCTTGTM
jgi:hypothetical protein